MLYNRCTGIYRFGNNTYPRRIRHRSSLGHIFGGESASYGPGNMVFCITVYLSSKTFGLNVTLQVKEILTIKHAAFF